MWFSKIERLDKNKTKQISEFFTNFVNTKLAKSILNVI